MEPVLYINESGGNASFKSLHTTYYNIKSRISKGTIKKCMKYIFTKGPGNYNIPEITC